MRSLSNKLDYLSMTSKQRSKILIILKIALPVLLFFFYTTDSFTQNLIPDSGFEKRTEDNCYSPTQGFNHMQYWYLLDATPDLFVGGCDFDENAFGFWEAASLPYEGNNYAGIWSRWNSNSTYFSEGIATPLQAPLENSTYYFEMAIRNKGQLQGFDDSIASCALHPDKHIDLYIAEDSIYIVNNFSNGTASTDASLVASLNSDDIQSSVIGEWTLISTCFDASGGEKYFAIIMPLGTFGELPPCAASASSGVFRSFYYNLDATFLTVLPNQLEAEMVGCDDQDFEVNIIELFDFPLLKTATFIWEDDWEGDLRRLSKTGIYSISAELACGSIPLTLKILPKNCKSNIFIPNAFSPNADGINDVFQAYISNQQKVINFQMSVYDRWGGVLFESNDPSFGWNGKKQNQIVDQGIYPWIISFETNNLAQTNRVMKSGEVLVIK